MVQKEFKNPYNKPDEISIRDLILKVGEYLRFLSKYWYFILLGCMAMAARNYHSTSKIKPTYPASFTLLLKPQDIAKENKTAIQIFSRLFRSRELVGELLFEKTDIPNKNDFLINQYLSTFFKYKPEQLDKDIPKDFKFSHGNISTFNAEEKLAYKRLLEKITNPQLAFEDGFITVSFDENLGFITVNTSTPTEELSLSILDELEKKVHEMINYNVLFPQEKAYSGLKIQVDSLREAYRNSFYQLQKLRDEYEYQLNTVQDSTSNIIRYLRKKIHQQDIATSIHKIDFESALKQLGPTEIEMNVKSPLVQVVAKPYPPLEPFQPSVKSSCLKGGITGVALVIALLLLYKIYLDILKEVTKEEKIEQPRAKKDTFRYV